MALADEYAPFFEWVLPDKFVSGADLDPATDLKELRLYCDPVPQSSPLVLTDIVTSWQAPVGFFPAGEYTCKFTTVAIDAKGGGEAEFSNTQTFTVTPDKPMPTVIFKVS